VGYKPTKGQFIPETDEFHGIRLPGKETQAEELLQRIRLAAIRLNACPF
jgi:hypothetical protein